MVIASASIVIALTARPAGAQQVEIKAPPSRVPVEPRIVPSPLHYETTRPPDAYVYPEPPKVVHDPAFIEPFTKTYQTSKGSGRFGLSGWTSPNPPVGSRQNYQEVSGDFAVGFSLTWDGPPASPSAAKRPPR